MRVIKLTKQASYGMDWIRAVIIADNTLKHDVRNKAQELFGDVEWVESATTPFSYNHGVECEFAGFYWHEDHPEFGIMCDMSGSRLSAARREKIAPINVLGGLYEQGWKFKRIDLAMDVYEGGGRPREMYNEWQKGAIKTKARKVTIIQSRTQSGVDGETVYFGSRQSDVMVRVYDKAAERGHDADCIRVELECKGDRAIQVAESVYEQGTVKTIAALLREQFTQGLPDWITKAIDYEFQIVAMAASTDTNFERWFTGTVIPAIEKAVRTGVPDAELLIRQAVSAGRAAHGK